MLLAWHQSITSDRLSRNKNQAGIATLVIILRPERHCPAHSGQSSPAEYRGLVTRGRKAGGLGATGPGLSPPLSLTSCEKERVLNMTVPEVSAFLKQGFLPMMTWFLIFFEKLKDRYRTSEIVVFLGTWEHSSVNFSCL